MGDSFTLVTSFYDVRAKEGGVVGDTKTIDTYLELGRSTLLRLDLPLVFFTDNMRVYQEVVQQRTALKLMSKTLVVWLPFEETFFYRDKEILQERIQSFPIHNRNADKDTALYVIVNNNKFDYLDRAIAMNPFGTSYFLWMDYGIQHCASTPPEVWNALPASWGALLHSSGNEVVHQMKVHQVQKDPQQPWRDFFQTTYHHIAGGCFGGHSTALQRYSCLFKEKLRQILEEGWYQLDEAIMTMISEEHRSLFRFWYGDYDGIVTNFIRTERCWALCFRMVQVYLDQRNYEESEKVLASLDGVMLDRDVRIMDDSFLRFVGLRICNDFYRWDGHLSKTLETILLGEQLDYFSLQWIHLQSGNLRHYRDTATMRFLGRWCWRDPINDEARQAWALFREKATECQWIPMGNRYLSVLALEKSDLRKESFPLDYLEVRPDQVLQLLTRQFQDFFTDGSNTNSYGIRFDAFKDSTVDQNKALFRRRIRRFYASLETPTCPVVFLHTTESFLESSTSTSPSAYDEQIVEISEFLERNYPDLDFRILCIMTNRTFHKASPRIIPFTLYTPLSFTKEQETMYREGVYTWMQQMLLSK